VFDEGVKYTWVTRELPILQASLRRVDAGERPLIEDVRAEVGLDEVQMDVAIEALVQADYLEMAGHHIFRVLERGRRELGPRGFKSLPLRSLLLVALVALAVLAAPRAASAHIRSGVVAVDYRADVLSAPRGVAARIYESDLAVRVSAGAARQVVVLGYRGEPFIRIGPAGATVTRASLTAAGSRVSVQGRSAVWHDARLRGLAPGVERRRWTIPLVVDGRGTRLDGEVWRVEAPPVWPWALLAVPFLVLVALLLVVRPMHWVRVGAVGLGLAAAVGLVLTGAGLALDSYASEGKWVEAANELVFTLVGVLVVVRGKPDTRAIAGGALGVLGLAVGLSKLPVFTHGLVLSVLPSNLARAVVALTIATGAAATCLGLVVFADVTERPEEEPQVFS
jgi:hypothetical protein